MKLLKECGRGSVVKEPVETTGRAYRRIEDQLL